MAQNKLDFYIASHVQGMEEVSKLINRVGALEKELKRLASANNQVASSTQAVIQNGKRYNNALDAQSKALRNARQGTQMAMMQVNDFVTSVSTGASPVQAFNQQIGQLGYSMTLMGGRAGAFGRVLAGPWGLAIIGAATAIGLMSGESDKGGKAFERMTGYFVAGASQIASKLRDELAPEIEAIAPLVVKVSEVAGKAAQKTSVMFEDMLNAYIAYGVGATKITVSLFRRQFGVMGEAFVGALNFMIGGWNKFVDLLESGFNLVYTRSRAFMALMGVDLPEAAANLSNLKIDKIANKWSGSFATMAGEIGDAVSGMGRIRDRYIDFQSLDPVSFTKPEAKKERGGAKSGADRAKGQKDENKALEEYLALLGTLNTKELPEWQRQIAQLTEKFEALNSEDQAKWAESFREAISQITYDPEKFLELAGQISQKALPEWQSQIEELTKRFEAMSIEGQVENLQAYHDAVNAVAAGPLDALIQKYDDLLNTSTPLERNLAEIEKVFQQQKVVFEQLGLPMEELIAKYERLKAAAMALPVKEANDRLKQSFESVGSAVSDAFKGMLTGAQSWKDGVKGIIRAVIDELWRLYVVQQIVGFVAKALGGLGLPAPGGVGQNALGTQNWKGGPTWVGERGPEIVNLPRGSQVIPAHRAQNMGGGGTVINVDARGSSDPEAVRRQVQMGIMEAAPQLIAASEARTLQSLRRPRLAGGPR